jgi:hypothetical protein
MLYLGCILGLASIVTMAFAIFWPKFVIPILSSQTCGVLLALWLFVGSVYTGRNIWWDEFIRGLKEGIRRD